jgi:hypothetical protein
MAWTNLFLRESLMIDVLTHPCGWIGTQKSAIIKKRKSWKSYKYSKSVLAHAKYVKDRNECTNAVSESKSKVKSFWNYINSKLKTRSGIGTLERSDGTLASSEADTVEVLNTFFAWPDGLHSKVLFEVQDSIYYPLYLFFNKSIEEGRVPA